MKTGLLKFCVVAAFLCGAAGVAFAHCGFCATGPGNILEKVHDAKNFDTLHEALHKADLTVMLAGDGPFTLFAPNDAAFAKLSPGELDEMLADEELLKQILLFHIVPAKVTSDDMKNLDSVTTAGGQTLTFDIKDGVIMIGDARVIKADIPGTNGVIHVIDTVLIPE